MTRRHRIAVLAGDGVGREVMPEGLRVLEAAAARFGFALDIEAHDFASVDHYRRTGAMMPPDWRERLGRADAIYLGAVGWRDAVPDHVAVGQTLVGIRHAFDQYLNLRPVKLWPGVDSPLRQCAPSDIDMVIVRENSEGEYLDIGGKMFEGTAREMVLQQMVMTRHGVDRAARFAFGLAARRPRRRLTSATKSDAIGIAMPFWDARVALAAAEYPTVTWEQAHIDALCARLIRDPAHFDVIVGSNLFGDILSDIAAACAGGPGLAAAASVNPERDHPSLFEPVHGSAPDIAGQGVANPVAMIWSGALMLDHLGETAAAAAVEQAIAATLGSPAGRTRDLGGRLSTAEAGAAVASNI